MEETELILLDFVLQDIGSATYTEYNLDGDAAAYYAEHIDELLGAKIAILHSHDTMQAFFSGTDMSTLNEQASQCNNVLSIVVNNEGSYVAKFTEKHTVHDHNDIIVNTTRTDKWKYMGETPDSSTSMNSSNRVEEEDYVEIHCWDCDINRPLGVSIDNAFRQECLDKQVLFAKQKKEKSMVVSSNGNLYMPDLFSLDDFVSHKPKSDYKVIRSMTISIANLSFSNNYYPSNVLTDNLSYDFLEAFMDAWFEFYKPDCKQLREVLECFLRITYNDTEYGHTKDHIIAVLSDLIELSTENTYNHES